MLIVVQHIPQQFTSQFVQLPVRAFVLPRMQGRKVYAQMKTDYEQGMIVLNKNNIVKTLYREWATRLAPLRPPVDRLLLWIIQTGKYAPAAAWVITGQGTGLSYLQFDALWHIVLAPTECTLEDVHRLFFYQRGSMATGINERAMDSEWNITYDEAIQRAQQPRDTISQAAATADTVRRDMTTELDSVLGDTHHYGTGAAPETSPAADPRAPGQLAFDGLPIEGFMSVAEEDFVLLRLHEPFALHGVEYPRSFVWAYRHCTQLERGLVMPADAVLPMEVQLSLSADDRQFLGEVFSESTYCQVFSLPSSDDEAWGELDSDDARKGAVDSGDDDAAEMEE